MKTRAIDQSQCADTTSLALAFRGDPVFMVLPAQALEGQPNTIIL
jgi:hypothetical protein